MDCRFKKKTPNVYRMLEDMGGAHFTDLANIKLTQQFSNSRELRLNLKSCVYGNGRSQASWPQKALIKKW